MAESRCIICGERRNGLEVKGDYTISAIRWFKRNVTRNEKNYRLVVCKGCFLKYKKARDSYQRKRVAYTTLGVIFAVLLVLSSGGRLLTIIYGAGIVLFLYLLSQLSYMPDVRMPAVKMPAPKAKK
jgi:hypothetical protein